MVVRDALLFVLRSPTGKQKISLAFLTLTRILATVLDVIALIALGQVADLVFSGAQNENRLTDLGILQPLFGFGNSALNLTLIAILGFGLRSILSVVTLYGTSRIARRLESTYVLNEVENSLFRRSGETRPSLESEVASMALVAGRAMSLAIFSLFTVISEIFYILMLIAFIGLVAPEETLVMVLYGLTIFFLLNRLVSREVTVSSRKITESSRHVSELLASASANSWQIKLAGSSGSWLREIGHARQRLSDATARNYLLASMPRYVIEMALILALFLGAVLYLLNPNISADSFSVAILGGGALRIMSSALPLQSSLATLIDTSIQVLSSSRDNWTDSDASHREITVKGRECLKVYTTFPETDWSSPSTLKKSMHFYPGDVTLVCGPSGAGKTSLLKALSGEISLGDLEIEIDEHSARDFALARPDHVGIVPQNPEMATGDFETAFSLNFQSQLPFQDIRALLRKFRLDAKTLYSMDASKLSGGEKQRVSLARILHFPPKIALLDEPTSGLNSELASETIAEFFRGINPETVVFISSHKPDILPYANQLLALSQGHKLRLLDISDKTPQEKVRLFVELSTGLNHDKNGVNLADGTD